MSGSKKSFRASVQSFIQRGSGDPPNEARSLGDGARDQRDWVAAAAHYEAHLASVPEDAAIWIQLGHMRKEGGDVPGAEDAYRRAETLTPDDADLMLQLGHLFRVAGRPDEAAAYYGRSIAMQPTTAAHDALAALTAERALEQRVILTPTSRVGNTFLQINDFLFYLHHHKTVSGIQRVQLGVINYVLAEAERSGSTDIGFVYGELRGTKLQRLSDATIRVVASYVSQADVDHTVLRGYIADAIASAMPVTLHKGDVFFLLGAFWGMGGPVELLRSLKARGVKSGLYFYDLIPVTHPEYCDDRLTADFSQALVEALSFIDFGLAISDYTAREVRRFVASTGLRPLPVEAVALAHNLKGAASDVSTEDTEWPASLSELRPGHYVLYVSTIEARKNHRYLFDAWKALGEEGLDLPDLVFVGRRGWRVEDLFAQFTATNYLNGRIKVLHDVSDAELRTLYKNCSFSVFPSVVEGWGLPIGESLSYGKLCVASNTSSMPEVGGDFVEYIDPLNLRGGLDTLRLLLNNPDEIRRREDAIRTRFVVRDWDAVSQSCIETLQRLAASVTIDDRPAYVPRLTAGQAFSPTRQITSQQPVGRISQDRMRQLILFGNWSTPEDFGTWMEGHEGNIAFSTEADAAQDVIVYMELATVPWVQGNVLTVHSPDSKPVTSALQPSKRFTLRIRTRSDQSGKVAFRLTVSGTLAAQADDLRLLSIGLRQLAYAPADDALARIEIVEYLTLDREGSA